MKKTGDMAVEQVAFNDQKLVARVTNAELHREVLRRLVKTQVVVDKHESDLMDERLARDREVLRFRAFLRGLH